MWPLPFPAGGSSSEFVRLLMVVLPLVEVEVEERGEAAWDKLPACALGVRGVGRMGDGGGGG